MFIREQVTGNIYKMAYRYNTDKRPKKISQKNY